MSLQSVERAGILSYMANLVAHGGSKADTIARAALAYPGENPAVYELAWRDSNLAGIAGGWVNGLGPGQKLPAADIPGYYPGRTGFKYSILATYTDTASGDTVVKTMIVSTPTQYDYQTLYGVVANGAPPPGIGGGITNKPGGYGPTLILSSIDVYSLERE